MPHLAPAVARRIDRLSWRAHLFHRFAHHPLCREYESEVIRVGRRGRVCKGCALLAVGLFAGAIAGFAVRVPAPVAVVLAVGAALLGATSLARRLGKVVSRFAPAAIAGLVCANAVSPRAPADLAAPAFIVTAVAMLYVGYRRRGPDRGACASCPERDRPASCRGMTEIVRRERAFRRLAGRLIDGRAAQSLADQ